RDAPLSGFAHSGVLNPGIPNTSIYVEGIPADATEREIAHIFRPFIGYMHLRFVVRQGRNPLCFVEFSTVEPAVAALEGLQGYVVDPRDPLDRGLRLEFAKAKSYGHHHASSGSSGSGRMGGGPGGTGAGSSGSGTGGYITSSGAAVGPQAAAF